MATISHERLLEVLDYDPATGIFCWKIRSSNRIHIGDRAGVVSGEGHRFITVDRQKLQASRLAWFYVRGEWPVGDLKMLNGNADDCSLTNLKPMTRIESARLRGALTTNTTGYRGVSVAKYGKWKASVTANYKQVMLGVFDTKEKASEIYEEAMAVIGDAKTPDECEVAIKKIIQLRRSRVAWERLQRSGRPQVWLSLEAFRADVGEIDEDEATIAAVDESKPIGPENFGWLAKVAPGHDHSTKEGRAAYARDWRKVNPGRWRHTHLKTNYGVDDTEYHRLVELQNGKCAICHREETKVQNGAVRSLSIDHDHETGKVRGLLCGNCNNGIGYFGNDRPDLLRSAATYLDRYYGRKLPWSVPVIEEITDLSTVQRILAENRLHG